MESQNRAVLFVVTIGYFLMPFIVAAINIALPSIGKEFALDAVVLGWIPTLYRLAAAIFLLPFGRLSDIYGRKRVFTYGIMVFTGSSFIAGIANSSLMLLMALIILGIGSSMIFGTGVAILTSVFPSESRGQVLGINVASVYTGLSLGPFIGGFLTQNFGWRSLFLVSVPLGILIVILINWQVQGEWADARGEKFDIVGSGIFGLTLITIMYGFSQLPEIFGAWILLGGLIGVLGFVIWEMKILNPILDMKLFRTSRMFAFSNLATWMIYCANTGVSFLISLYLQYIKGFSPQTAGMILIAQPIIQASFSPVAGRLSDKIEPRRVASLGIALMVVGLSLFTRLNDTTHLASLVINLLFLGMGFALFTSPNTNAVMSSVEKKVYGVASGTIGTMRLIGQMFSMGIATLLFALYIGRVQITPESYPLFLNSIHAAFIIYAIICFGGLFVSLARGNVR